MKIAGVDFPEPLLNALRDGRLVVFAGAGVSMGPPAGLPSFGRLAEQVAEGTGQSIRNAETEDQFLGRLKDRGTDVHQRAAQILQRNNPKPTALHSHLLRFFHELEAVRTVTTNFDDLFERATLAQFNSQPKLFQAPVLPLGNRFRGIVHLHGSVNEPAEMVLTHLDFGRAYLTESDGWARRFVIDLFANYMVLFVGYSHNDTIMTYLTPSLPRDDGQKRFALVGDHSGDIDHWSRMGIEPVTFHQADANDFGGLNEAVASLANFIRRGVLEWQNEITTIARGNPPIDDDGASTIAHALTEPELTRFFVEAAVLPEWINWLDRRRHLDHLFSDGDLEDQYATLSHWLARRFTVQHPDELFSAIVGHGGRINSYLWNQLAWQLGQYDDGPLDAKVVSRWVHFLMSCVPPQPDEWLLSGLAETCAKVRALNSLLQVYDAMTATRHQVMPGLEWDASGDRLYLIQSLWNECLEPNLPNIAHSLLERTTMRLEERRSAVVAWREGDNPWDEDSYDRLAIEHHEQDEIPHSIDVLIDVARGCLEWLASNDPVTMGVWCNRFIGSPAPLLRRLAIHAMAACTDLSADDKIAWLLERCDVNETAAHHELFRAAAQAYSQASSEQKWALIQVISEYQAPKSEHYDSDYLSAHHRFTWFHWLHTADPDCSIVNKALAAVRAQHPDFTHRSRESEITSPWSADALLAKPAPELLPVLLAYQPTNRQIFDGHDRWAMLREVEKAAQTSPTWGLDLADAMAGVGAWDSDLWQHVIFAWTTAELDEDRLRRILQHLSAGELHLRHAREIAEVLTKLVWKTDTAEATGLRDKAKSIAIALRPYAAASELPQITSSVGGVPQHVSWLSQATSHASGKLALFWTHSIEMWRQQQQPAPESLNVEYRNQLDAIIGEDGVAGRLGRTVLASQFPFFLTADEHWTLDNLLPLFDARHDDFQCAWDGFLTWGHLSPSTAECLRGKFIAAVPRIVQDFGEQMRTRFVQFYSVVLGWLINGANDDWITEFFKHADANTKNQFAVQIGHRLRNLDETGQHEWWSVWLKDYWENRLQGVPVPLDDAEIAQMLEWVMHLPGVFPDAVDVATRMRPISLTRSRVLYRIGESSLIKRYPKEIARLLIHFGECNVQPFFWYGTRDAVDKLLEKGLPSNLDQGLRELIAKRHQWMGG